MQKVSEKGKKYKYKEYELLINSNNCPDSWKNLRE